MTIRITVTNESDQVGHIVEAILLDENGDLKSPIEYVVPPTESREFYVYATQQVLLRERER